MRMNLARIADVIDALRPTGALAEMDATGISTDTRTIVAGDLYIALSGERFDGHEFVSTALAQGAIAAVVSRAPAGVRPEKLLEVPDTLTALAQIATEWRREFSIPVIAVTGSVGKTSTKDLIACALSSLGPILRTDKNENNEIGLPKTLLRLTDEHKAVVVEMGMRGKGQIRHLAQVAQPTIGIVTIIGESHIELLGSRESIARAKAELFDYLAKTNGTAVFNEGDDFAGLLANAAGAARTMFADATVHVAATADYKLLSQRRTLTGWSGKASGPGGIRFDLNVESPARHDLVNALGAVAVAAAAGVAPADAAAGVAYYRPGEMRMEILKSASGATVISDCYNAAPTSMRAALETLAASTARGRKIAFLGDMKELGAHAQQMHEQVAQAAVELGISELYVVGEDFARVADSARRRFETSTQAAQFAATDLSPATDDAILVKGSRSMKMETIVAALTGTEANAH